MFDNIRSQARRQGAPATYAIIGVAIVSFVISFLLQGARSDPLAFYSNWSQPWGLATYPFSLSGFGLSIIAFLFELWWFFWVGSSAERDLGTQKFVGVFFGSTVLAGIFLGVGLNILGIVDRTPIIFGFSLPLAFLTVMWGVRNAGSVIQLYMIIPVQGRILAWLTAAVTLFSFGVWYHAPLLGVFSILHLGVAVLFATNRLPFFLYRRQQVVDRQAQKKQEMMSKAYYDDVNRRSKEREERERLRRMFEDSMDE